MDARSSPSQVGGELRLADAGFGFGVVVSQGLGVLRGVGSGRSAGACPKSRNTGQRRKRIRTPFEREVVRVR